MKVAITAGYNNSKHAIALIYGLQQQGIEVDTCLIVKTFSLKRFRYYYRQLDKKELFKKLRDRVFNKYVDASKLSDEIKYINNYFKEHKIPYSSVSEICNKTGIKCKVVGNLNDPDAIDYIKDSDLLVYAGGGILKQQLIDTPKIGVLNCHSSRLPEIRGMNATEWSFFLDVPTANTMHFIVRKVDQGPIIQIIDRDYSHCISIDQIRGQAITYMVEDLCATVQKIKDNNYTTTTQKPADGKQYYAMHPVLKDVVNAKLRRLHSK